MDDQGALPKLHFRHRHIFLLEGVLERIISSRTAFELQLKAVSPISPKGVLLDLIYTLAQCAHFATDASSVLTPRTGRKVQRQPAVGLVVAVALVLYV